MSSLSASIDPKSIQAIKNALDEFAVDVQDRITKSALRQFAHIQMTGISQHNMRWLNPKHMAYRVKFWPSGIAWLGVGYRTPPGQSYASNYARAKGRAARRIYDEEGTGWRSHFAELGFHSWGAGLKRPPVSRKSGRGWKKGLYHRGRGVYHRGTLASVIVQQATSPLLIPYLEREIQFMREKKYLGKKARRKKVETFTGGAA